MNTDLNTANQTNDTESPDPWELVRHLLHTIDLMMATTNRETMRDIGFNGVQRVHDETDTFTTYRMDPDNLALIDLIHIGRYDRIKTITPCHQRDHTNERLLWISTESHNRILVKESEINELDRKHAKRLGEYYVQHPTLPSDRLAIMNIAGEASGEYAAVTVEYGRLCLNGHPLTDKAIGPRWYQITLVCDGASFYTHLADWTALVESLEDGGLGCFS